MTNPLNWLSVLFLFLPFTDQTTHHTPPPTTATNAKIQVALLLDTSNSMDGLIEQAKSQLWKMVNELATSKKDGKAPDIEIALYHYGNDGLDGRTGHIQQISPMTADLDLISEKLFQLTTNGGQEYCGWVVRSATDELDWSASHDDLKLIIIAGNEPYNQGTVDYRESCKKAIAKGIMINTIFCGNEQEGIRTFWKDGAECADGQFMTINQNEQVVHIPTPYDDDILKLNERLNKTYIGYGAQGQSRMEMQVAQDANAAGYSSANARERASFKAKSQYKNTAWDLVDAAEEDEAIIEEVKAEELPEEMKNMTVAERKEYVEAKKKERQEIQQQIRELDEKAKAYVTEKRKELSATQTLDNVMLDAVKKQAKSKNFQF